MTTAPSANFISVSSHSSVLRGRGLVFVLLFMVSGCATKGDTRLLQETLAEQKVEQDFQLLMISEEIQDLKDQLEDQLEDQSDRLLNIRGDIGLDLTNIQDQLSRLSVLTGQLQRSMVTLSERLAVNGNQNPVGFGTEDLSPDIESGDRESSITPEEIYQAAMVQFDRGSLGTARRAFESLLMVHPDHRLAPSAQFFLADLLSQENSLDEAIEAFLRILELYPTSDRVPQALYRVGELFVIQENIEEAINHLERLITTYPDSGAAELAQELLQEIR